MATSDIYPVVIARDAAETIEITLESLKAFPEVIVYDCGSRDRTRELCAAYPNAQFVDGEFLGSGRTKNQAAGLAEGDWILALDADEYLSDGLLATLGALSMRGPETAYSMHRHNLFMDKDIKWGGWGNDWVVRLYNRRTYHFSDAVLHEKVSLSTGAKIEPLKGALWHQAVIDIDQLLKRISRRSELAWHAEGRVYSPPLIVLNSLWILFRSYFLQLGFLEGWRGLVIAATDAAESFFGRMKRYSEAPVDSAATLGTKTRF